MKKRKKRHIPVNDIVIRTNAKDETELFIDGVEVHRVKSISFCHDGTENVNVVSLDLKIETVRKQG